MKGRVKAGEGTLVGNAGEYYVMAELLKRGVIAALAPRNAPIVDILATKGDKTIRIRVKTKSEEYSVWQWVVKEDGSIFRNILRKGDFTVLVNLGLEIENIKFYIIPTPELDNILKKDFNEWVQTPGKNGRPRSTQNRKRHLDQKKHSEFLEKYRNNWNILWE